MPGRTQPAATGRKIGEQITRRQLLELTFRTNVFGMFFMTRAAIRHFRPGSSVINATSVTAYRVAII